jgi:hypothetical protein
LKALPAFDNSVSFGITLDEANQNIRGEIKELVFSVSSEKPPVFNSNKSLGNTNADGFKDLFNVLDQISCMQIIRHDNSLQFDCFKIQSDVCPDFRPANIMVKANESRGFSMATIIDWEHGGGFYPDYWESVKSISLLIPNSKSDSFLYLLECISSQTHAVP